MECTSKEIEEGRLFAFLAYWGPLVLIPFLYAKENPFARYHARQGLALLIANIAAMVASGIMSTILGFISDLLQGAWFCFSGVAFMGLFVLAVIGMLFALQGETKEVPGLGWLADTLKL